MKIQTGTVPFENVVSGSDSTTVSFGKDFDEPPEVMVAISGLRTDSDENFTSVNLTATNVTEAGFVMTLTVTAQCKAEWLNASYMAFS
ncbi:H-type lectin domain-containing protein [Sphingomonas sp. PB2P19]|uniref:H-type lectin domain-containing protein n=1 Tax=Sphingomonas rhamnosi TaxID=3096156 RepID=UPI002FC72FCE